MDYSYLVRSIWDKKKKVSKQETIKYLGRTEKITLDDIPEDYIDNKNIIKFFAKDQNASGKNYNKYVEKVRKDLFKKLAGPGPINLSIVYDEYSDDFSIGKLNVDENSDIAAQYGIRSIPCLLFFKNGKVQKQIVGAVEKTEISTILNELK